MRRALLVPSALAVLACGSRIPEPEYVAQPADAYAEVPYPPPSAMSEIVPEQPHPDAVWVDGGWVFRGKYWVWDKGGWVIPPPGGKYARWHAFYQTDGSLLFARGSWRDAQGRRLRPRVLAPAATPSGKQTPEPARAR